MRRFALLVLALVAGAAAYRPLLDHLGEGLANGVVDLVREERFEEAVELEQSLLNPVQRLLGAPRSDYAARKWRGE